MASGSLEIVVLCSCALFRPYNHDILLAWHRARMLSCSHTRGVIMLFHFPAPTASCPHAPNHLQSLTCKETLPHCLASRSLIVQVSPEARFRGDVSRAGPQSARISSSI